MHHVPPRAPRPQTPPDRLPQIEQAKQEWEVVVDTLPHCVCLLDAQGRILRANRTIERWGLARVSDVYGRELHELLHAHCPDRECYLQRF